MKKVFLLIIALFIFQDFFGQEEWDEKHNTYISHDYDFAWDLGTDPDWERVMKISKKTVFKAKCTEIPVIVFVMPNEYNAKLENADVWEKYEEIKQLEDVTRHKFLETGINQKTLSVEKVSFAGKHAVKIVNKIEGVDKNDLAVEKSTKITIRTIHNGRLYSVCITLLTELYDELVRQGVNIESIYKGFVFINDHKLNSITKSDRNNSEPLTESENTLITNKLIEFCKQLNQQTPIQVDEITTLYSVAYINKSIKFFYKIDFSIDNFTDEEINTMQDVMKQTQIQQFKAILNSRNKTYSDDMYLMMDMFDLKICFVYRDINDKILFETVLTYEDLK